ncbi:hypothetical protein [Georgenia sp. SUBG003]|uniref:hypothetical protein n=1 Tax=Georgenia sp. SUBG003 TaxID=1497974 RepID=UPI003AB7198C
MRVFHVKMGIRNMVMPGGAQRDDRGDEVDGAEDGREPGHGQAEDPEVTAEAGAAPDDLHRPREGSSTGTFPALARVDMASGPAT